MKRKQVRLILIVIAVFMIAILSLNKIETFIKEATIPHYKELTQIGYDDEQILIIQEHGDEEIESILISEYQPDIIKRLTLPHYDDLRKIGYSEQDLNTILKAEEAAIIDLKKLPLLNTWKTYLARPGYRNILLSGYGEEAGQKIDGLPETLVQSILEFTHHSEYDALVLSDQTILSDLTSYLTYWEKHPTAVLRDVQERVNTETDRAYYTGILPADTSKGNLILVNKYVNLDKNFVPSDLTTIEVCGKATVTSDTAAALTRMCQAMIANGLHPKVTSSYRSYSTQMTLYNRYVANNGKASADTFSARPGHSEHQTGLAIDILTNSSSLSTFKNTAEYRWMVEHAVEYGFIQRYTDQKQSITGYVSEPWHWRYVGESTAIDYQTKKLTFDEYYRLYIQ